MQALSKGTACPAPWHDGRPCFAEVERRESAPPRADSARSERRLRRHEQRKAWGVLPRREPPPDPAEGAGVPPGLAPHADDESLLDCLASLLLPKQRRRGNSVLYGPCLGMRAGPFDPGFAGAILTVFFHIPGVRDRVAAKEPGARSALGELQLLYHALATVAPEEVVDMYSFLRALSEESTEQIDFLQAFDCGDFVDRLVELIGVDDMCTGKCVRSPQMNFGGRFAWVDMVGWLESGPNKDHVAVYTRDCGELTPSEFGCGARMSDFFNFREPEPVECEPPPVVRSSTGKYVEMNMHLTFAVVKPPDLLLLHFAANLETLDMRITVPVFSDRTLRDNPHEPVPDYEVQYTLVGFTTSDPTRPGLSPAATVVVEGWVNFGMADNLVYVDNNGLYPDSLDALHVRSGKMKYADEWGIQPELPFASFLAYYRTDMLPDVPSPRPGPAAPGPGSGEEAAERRAQLAQFLAVRSALAAAMEARVAEDLAGQIAAAESFLDSLDPGSSIKRAPLFRQLQKARKRLTWLRAEAPDATTSPTAAPDGQARRALARLARALEAAEVNLSPAAREELEAALAAPLDAGAEALAARARRLLARPGDKRKGKARPAVASLAAEPELGEPAELGGPGVPPPEPPNRRTRRKAKAKERAAAQAAAQEAKQQAHGRAERVALRELAPRLFAPARELEEPAPAPTQERAAREATPPAAVQMHKAAARRKAAEEVDAAALALAKEMSLADLD